MQATAEISRTRASVVCVYEGKVLCVRLEDPVTKVIRPFPPGGMIERNEQPSTAAERETLEETGYRVEVIAQSLITKRYPFVWGNKTYDCLTHFFRAELLTPEPQPVSDTSFFRGIEWIPTQNVLSALNFDKTIQEAVKELLNFK